MKKPKLVPTEYIPYLVNRAAIATLNYSAASMESYGLTVPMWRVLTALTAYGALRVRELVDKTSIEPPTLSRLLSELSKMGLVSRTRVPTDTRSAVIALTPAGVRRVDRVMPFALDVERLQLQGIGAREAAILRRALVRIYENMRSAPERKTPTNGRPRHAPIGARG